MWLLLVTTLPTENATIRQRVWRSLKASGAAVLRDGVYLMPDTPACRAAFDAICTEVHAGKGNAWTMPAAEPAQGEFKALFNRSGEYAALLAELSALQATLSAATQDTVIEHLKQVRKLRKSFTALEAIDFFPGPARGQTETALQRLEQSAARILAPDEPQPAAGDIHRLELEDYRGKTWATRQRPWVDRLASAWLIKGFIDPAARFLWLKQPADCPAKALGFDFDGAAFTHVGNRVTFEVLLASFGLEQPALLRIAALVHYLDVGGVQPPEAAGIESVLAGLRTRITDDDELLAASNVVFDSLHASFNQETDSRDAGK